jgi:protein involved in polysaccharide export with SLBB domain
MLRVLMINMLLIGMMTSLSADASLAQSTAETQTQQSVAASAPYLLAGDDVLSINIASFGSCSWPHVIVAPDGKLAVPLLKPFSILGKTTAEVAQMLAEKWKRCGINPSVSVSLVLKRRVKGQPLRAPGDRLPITEIGNWVFVIGAVAHPGFYNFKPGDRLLDALDAAGGLTS